MMKDRERMADAAYRGIEELFVTGALPPGGMVSESGLGRRLQLGRAPIRDAIKKFEADGLLTPMHRKGIFVARMDAWHQLHLLEVREPIEILIVRLAAYRANDDERGRLRACAQTFRKAVETESNKLVLEADYEYKQIVVAATRNIYLPGTIRPIHILSRRFWNSQVTFQSNEEAMRETCDHHSAIASAVADADAQAAEDSVRAFIAFLKDFTRAVLDKHYSSAAAQ